MRKATVSRASVFAVVAVGGFATTLSGQAAPVADRAPVLERLQWMAGCWERSAGDRWLEEQWMRPRGGMMLGMSRMVRGDRVVGHEAVRIEEREDGLVYVADPSGQAVTEFRATEVSDTSVAFENPEHDFPQRILYRKGVADSLFARIEGPRDGETRGVDFRMGRVPCRAP